jgi:hypothetical protein
MQTLPQRSSGRMPSITPTIFTLSSRPCHARSSAPSFPQPTLTFSVAGSRPRPQADAQVRDVHGRAGIWAPEQAARPHAGVEQDLEVERCARRHGGPVQRCGAAANLRGQQHAQRCSGPMRPIQSGDNQASSFQAQRIV